VVRLLIALPAVLILGACAGGGAATNDVYALRLAIENLQAYETDATESFNAQLRALRANQDQIQSNLERRIDSLEAKITRLEEMIARLSAGNGVGLGGEPVEVRRVLVLPPDPETLRQTPSPENVGAETPTQRPPVTNPYGIQEPISPPQ
jgi:hypothetical protein